MYELKLTARALAEAFNLEFEMFETPCNMD